MSQDSLNTLDLTKTCPLTGWDLYKTEEFKALCRLLNIAYAQRTIDINIFISCDELVTITQTYRASVNEGVFDTTSTHNKQFRTKIPNIGEDDAHNNASD